MIEAVEQLTEAIRNRNTELLGYFFEPSYNGSSYYVDGNYGHDGRTGADWTHPLSSLTEAISRSNTDIARGADRWAHRNRIFVIGDELTENLVAFPQKCDIIGVGSDSGFPMAGLLGNHVPVNSAAGTRIFNMHLIPVAAAPIISMGATGGNCEVRGCVLDSSGTLTATIGILITAASWCKIIGNMFVQSGGAGFSTAAIDVATGASHGLVIEGNRIMSASKGIRANSGRTGADSWIKDNYIKSTLACIDEQSSTFHIVGNKGITLAAKGSSLAGAVVGNVALSCDNKFTCAGTDNNIVWPAAGSI
jgi:hypothetical protein